MLFIAIRSIIITYCNPVVGKKLLQHCLGCVVGGSTLATTGIGFHVTSTTPGLQPLNMPGVTQYQKAVLGFTYETVEGGVVGHAYQAGYGELPITTGPNKAVDIQACRARFAQTGNGALP